MSPEVLVEVGQFESAKMSILPRPLRMLQHVKHDLPVLELRLSPELNNGWVPRVSIDDRETGFDLETGYWRGRRPEGEGYSIDAYFENKDSDEVYVVRWIVYHINWRVREVLDGGTETASRRGLGPSRSHIAGPARTPTQGPMPRAHQSQGAHGGRPPAPAVVGRARDVRIERVRERDGYHERVLGRHVGVEPGVNFIDELDQVDLGWVEEGAGEVVEDIGVLVQELKVLQLLLKVANSSKL